MYLRKLFVLDVGEETLQWLGGVTLWGFAVDDGVQTPSFSLNWRTFWFVGYWNPGRGRERSSSKVRLASLSAFLCIMGCNIIPVIHLTNSLLLQSHRPRMQVCLACRCLIFLLSLLIPGYVVFLVAVVYVAWWAGESSERWLKVETAGGLCALPGYRMFSVICGTGDPACCSVSGGVCWCLCCSRNPKLGLFVPGL